MYKHSPSFAEPSQLLQSACSFALLLAVLSVRVMQFSQHSGWDVTVAGRYDSVMRLDAHFNLSSPQEEIADWEDSFGAELGWLRGGVATGKMKLYFLTIILLAFSVLCSSGVLQLFYWFFRVSGKERERERNINLLFHFFMHSLVDFCMCLDQGKNP